MNREIAPRLYIFLLVGVSCLLLAPTLIYPPGRDQGMFTYAGHLVLRGDVPFKDFWDTKPPAIYYAYGLAELLFGYSVFAIRALDLLWQAATAVILFEIARRIIGRRFPAFFAGAFYVIAYASRGWWNTAQPDDFLNLPLGLAVLIVLKKGEGGNSGIRMLAAGALVGIASYFRYPVAVILPVLAAYIVWDGGDIRRYRPAVMMAFGFCAVTLGYLFYLWRAGAIGEFFYTEFVWTRAYAGLGGAGKGFFGFFHMGDILNSHWSAVTLMMLAAAAYIGAICRGSAGHAANLIALWAATAFLTLYIQRKFYIYHFSPLMAPLAVGAAAFVKAMSRASSMRFRSILVGLLAASVAVPYLTINGRYNRYCLDVYLESASALATKLRTGVIPEDYYMNARFTSDDFSFPADIAVARFLAGRTSQGDRVFIWGCETLVYQLSERRAVSRFIHNFPFRCDWTPERYGNELIDSLKADPPAYLLIVRNDAAWWATGTYEDSLSRLRRYPGLARFLEERYMPEGEIEDFLIYRRRD